MGKPEKFPFKELSSESVYKNSDTALETDDKIANAVIEHFNNVISAEKLVSGNEQESQHQTHQAIFSEASIQKIKDEAYLEGKNAGLLEAKKSFDYELSSIQIDNQISEKILLKLTEISSIPEPINEYVDLISLVLEEIVEKLALSFNQDLSKILHAQLKKLFEKSLNSAKIIVKVSPQKKDMCEKLIQNNDVKLKFNMIEVQTDSNLADSDCIVEYNQTKLLFDKTLVKNEIDEIIKQFRQDE